MDKAENLEFLLDLQPRVRALYAEWDDADDDMKLDRVFIYAVIRAAYGAGVIDGLNDAGLRKSLEGMGYKLKK
jgi:hypothetical protein